MGRKQVAPLLALAVLFGATTCRVRDPASLAANTERVVAIWVENEGNDPIAIYLDGWPARLATVMVGEARCVHLPVAASGTGATYLLAKVAQRIVAVSPRQDLAVHSGWIWRVQARQPTPELAGLALVAGEPCNR